MRPPGEAMPLAKESLAQMQDREQALMLRQAFSSDSESEDSSMEFVVGQAAIDKHLGDDD